MANDILKYPGWMYSYGIATGRLSMDEVKIEYQRLYHALRQRQRRMAGTEFEKSKFAKRSFVPYKQLRSESQMLEEIQSMASWARSRQSTVMGMREFQQDIESALGKYVPEHGKDFTDFTRSNWAEFGAFMHRIHKAKFDSDRALKVFTVAKKAGMTGASLKKDYDYWKNHTDELIWYTEDKGRPLGGRASSRRIRERIDQLKASDKKSSRQIRKYSKEI